MSEDQNRGADNQKAAELLSFEEGEFQARAVTKENSIPEVIDADMQIMNGTLLGMVAALCKVKTPGSACKVAATIANLVVTRRQLLLMPCNASENKKSPHSAYEPIP